MTEDLEFRKDLARELLQSGIEPSDLLLVVPEGIRAASRSIAMATKPDIPFPAGLAPEPHEIAPAPKTDDKVPTCDVLVVTWTVDEQRALCDVLTPGFSRDDWYRYDRDYARYDPKIRSHAPAKNARRLGSYFPTVIGTKKVLCFKSELHLNQDGVEQPPNGAPGNASLPVRDLFHQLIDEAKPSLVITTGTAGATFGEHDLGDVVVTRSAKFRVQREFRNADFAGKAFRSDWKIPTKRFDDAVRLMGAFKDQIADPEWLPPTANFAPLDHMPRPIRPNVPDIKLEGRDMAEFHPILTTDYFEFGTSKNELFKAGAAVEMGDAVLGLVVDDRRKAGKSAPNWLVVRNCSDPQINGDLRDKPAKQSLQATWAVYYYLGFGYWTSIMSAITTWGVIAGLE